MATAKQALEQNELQIAESRYRTVLLEGWLLVGALAVEAGDLQAARAAFELASVSAVETRRPRMSLALVEMQLGNPQTAVSLLRGLKKDDLSDAVVRRLIPRALMAADQVDEAIQEMEELHILNPGDLENTYALARAYLGQKRLEAAAPLFAELAERRPIPETHVLVGRTYRDFGHWAPAHEALLAALALDPQLRRANYYLGTVDLFAEGLDILDEAMGHLEAELQVTPDDPLSNLYLGAALVEQRRYEEAVPRLELATRLLEERPTAFEFLGRSYLAVGRIEEAVAALRRGLEIGEAGAERTGVEDTEDKRQSQLSNLHFHLAQALRRSGDEKAARRHFAAAKQSSANSTEGARELLESYLGDEETEESLAASTWPLELSPVTGFGPQERVGIERAVKGSLVQVYFNLAVLKTKAGQFDRAVALYSQAAELGPRLPASPVFTGRGALQQRTVRPGDDTAPTGPRQRPRGRESAPHAGARLVQLARATTRQPTCCATTRGALRTPRCSTPTPWPWCAAVAPPKPSRCSTSCWPRTPTGRSSTCFSARRMPRSRTSTRRSATCAELSSSSRASPRPRARSATSSCGRASWTRPKRHCAPS